MNNERCAILSVSDFAKKIQVSVPTVMRMIFDGRILAFRLSNEYGSHYRIKESEIDRLISWELEKKNNPILIEDCKINGLKRLIRIWRGIKERCENPKCHAYKYYGRKGIKLCERWQSFDFFLDDMGCAPIPWSIDRLDNNLGYEPKNCVWSTPKGQANNKTYKTLYDYNGRKVTLHEYCKIKNLNYNTLSARARRGLPIEKILSEEKFRPGRNKNA